MAISQKLPPQIHPTIHTEERSSSSSQSSSSVSYSSDGDSISINYTSDQNAGDSEEALAMAVSQKREPCLSRASPTPACLRVPRTCGKTRGRINGRKSLQACLHRHLASLRSILPPSARSTPNGNLILDALRYKKALAKQIQMLQSALPFSYQVNVERFGSTGLHIRVSCNKKSGLLIALMDTLESFGLNFANVSISCLNNKIKLDAVSPKASIDERRGSLKVALMATIMRFTQKGQERPENVNI